MRVIAGTLRRRTLEAPAGLATRPTSDRLRETLFNVLAPRMDGAAFLDLYAGSGAVGIEALSRGASRVVCVERAPAALKVMRANLERLGIGSGVRVEAVAVQAYLRPMRSGEGGFDVVFLDPPYEEEKEYAATLGMLGGAGVEPRSPSARDREHSLPLHKRGPVREEPGKGHPVLRTGGVVIAEHRRKTTLAETYGVLKRARVLEQGDAGLSFYETAVSC